MKRKKALNATAKLMARTSKEAELLFELIFLDKRIDENREKFVKELPFTNYHYLEKDHEMVTEYNSILKNYKASIDKTSSKVDELAEDLDLDVVGNHFERFAEIMEYLHITDEEARQYHLIRG